MAVSFLSYRHLVIIEFLLVVRRRREIQGCSIKDLAFIHPKPVLEQIKDSLLPGSFSINSNWIHCSDPFLIHVAVKHDTYVIKVEVGIGI